MTGIPEAFRADVEKAISLLKQIGCTEVYLFGSVPRDAFHNESDLDLAVRGCPADKFFYALGKLMTELSVPVDLVDLERDERFGGFLEKTGELFRVA